MCLLGPAGCSRCAASLQAAAVELWGQKRGGCLERQAAVQVFAASLQELRMPGCWKLAAGLVGPEQLRTLHISAIVISKEAHESQAA